MEKYHVVRALIPPAVVLGDGILKKYAEEKLADGETREIFGGHIRLRLFHNPGVALGAFEKYPKAVLAVNSGLLGAAAGILACLGPKEGVAGTGLGLLIGGGASNLADRVRQGCVTDYFSLNFGGRFRRLGRVVFNCSDFCVFTGVLLYIFGKKSSP